MYQLYIDKDNFILKVEPLKKHFLGWVKESTLAEDFVFKYNDNYMMSRSRKALVEFARELKAKWLNEAMEAVQKIEKIKI